MQKLLGCISLLAIVLASSPQALAKGGGRCCWTETKEKRSDLIPDQRYRLVSLPDEELEERGLPSDVLENRQVHKNFERALEQLGPVLNC